MGFQDGRSCTADGRIEFHMSKAVYLIEQPLDERNYDRLGIQTWIDRGWDIEVWDLTPLSYPQVWRNHVESGRELKELEDYYPITSKAQLKSRYAGLGPVGYFIDLTGDNFHSLFVKMRLVKMGAMRIICVIGCMPIPGSGWQSISSGNISKALKMGPVKLFKWLSGKFLHKLAVSVIRPRLGIATGSESLCSMGQAHEIIYAHNLDYDIYLKTRNVSVSSGGEYGVFIDQDMCFHSDFICEGMRPPATPERYFPSVSKALRNVAGTLGIPMRVAAHPRSSYSQRQDQDYFEGIPIIYGKTAELIKGCSVVLCHNSTAIQLAVLFEKPIIFLSTDELKASEMGPVTAMIASRLGKSVVNVDDGLDKIDWQKELCVDPGQYAVYRNRYVKTNDSPEKPHWDIVIDHIERGS